MRRCRVGIVGLGHVATCCHLPGYKGIDNIEVVAGSRRREDLLRKISAKWGIKGYTNFEEMLKKEDLDIAVITTGPQYTREITEIVAEYGVNILIEKPMALTFEDAKIIIETCEKENVKLAYGETYRFFPTIRKAKELIDHGVLGNLYLLLEIVIGGMGLENFHPYHIYPPGSIGLGETGLTDHGIHLIDVFRWLTGSEAEWVSGRGIRASNPPHTEWCTLIFQSGTIGKLIYNEATYPANLPNEGIFGPSYRIKEKSIWNPYPEILQVYGTQASLRIFTYPNKLYLATRETDERLRKQFGPCRMEEIPVRSVLHPSHFGLQIESFAKCIQNDEAPEITGIDGLRALQIVLAAYESFETKKMVQLMATP